MHKHDKTDLITVFRSNRHPITVEMALSLIWTQLTRYNSNFVSFHLKNCTWTRHDIMLKSPYMKPTWTEFSCRFRFVSRCVFVSFQVLPLLKFNTNRVQIQNQNHKVHSTNSIKLETANRNRRMCRKTKGWWNSIQIRNRNHRVYTSDLFKPKLANWVNRTNHKAYKFRIKITMSLQH